MPDALISYPFTEQGLRDALKALGTTPEAVHTNLIGMGFKGYLDECRNCPVANYTTAVITSAVATDVLLDDDDSAPFVRAYASLPWGQEEELFVEAEGTAAVADFIRVFDAGLYPDLIEEDSDASS